SKTHANKYQKNQRTQSNPPQQPPSTIKTPPPSPTPPTSSPTPTQRTTSIPTSTTTTTSTQKPQPFPSAQYSNSDETFVTVVSKPHSLAAHNPNIPQQNRNPSNTPNTPQSQSALLDFRTVDDIETISDASQNVHVQTAEPFRSAGRPFESSTALNGRGKFLAVIDKVETYADGGSHGNSVRAISDKAVSHEKYASHENAYRSSKQSNEYYGKIPDVKSPQKSRLQSYIVSDVAPQSFKPVPTVKVVALPSPEPETVLELIS
ncbi:PREDICTED: putative uncharacterized protein DDB_G0290521, partial [Rhagoletis zephyria]|uniref:putative uncharacterized protein DDB_G0290521 n=1 Tax=Rhagoletis zephyria TaxID=28612 RepID=UPI0008116A27